MISHPIIVSNDPKKDAEKLLVQIPKHQLFIQKIKKVKGYKFSKTRKAWTIPNQASTLRELIQIFGAKNCLLKCQLPIGFEGNTSNNPKRSIYKVEETTANVSYVKTPFLLGKNLSPKKVNDLLAQIKEVRVQLVLYIIYATGLRLKEVLQLQIKDMDAGKMFLFINKTKTTESIKLVLISEEVRKIWKQYCAKYQIAQYLFINPQTQEIYSEKTIELLFETSKHYLGLAASIDINTLRTCFAHHLLEGGSVVKLAIFE